MIEKGFTFILPTEYEELVTDILETLKLYNVLDISFYDIQNQKIFEYCYGELCLVQL